MTMHNTRILTITEIRQLIISAEPLSFKAEDRGKTYAWIEQTLRDLHYQKLKRVDKGTVTFNYETPLSLNH